MSDYEDFEIHIDPPATSAIPATHEPPSSKSSKNSRGPNPENQWPEDLIVSAIGFRLSEAIAADQVNQAWSKLTGPQKISIPDEKMRKAKALVENADSMGGLIAWRDFSISMIEEASRVR